MLSVPKIASSSLARLFIPYIQNTSYDQRHSHLHPTLWTRQAEFCPITGPWSWCLGLHSLSYIMSRSRQYSDLELGDWRTRGSSSTPPASWSPATPSPGLSPPTGTSRSSPLSLVELRAPKRIDSHWLRASKCWNIIMMLLHQQYYAIRSTFWHKDRWLPGMERIYHISKAPLRHKELWMSELVLYGIRVLAS